MNNEEFDYNMCIKEVVGQMLDDPSYDNFLHVIAELIIRVNDEGCVPTLMLNEIRIVWGVEPDTELEDVFPEDNGMGNKIVAFSSNRDGLKWLPIFTSREEVGDYAETNTVKYVPIREILERAYEDDDAAGIIINPNTDGFALRKEAIEIILNNSDGSVRHAC